VTGPRELRSSPGSRSAIGQSRSTVTSPGATTSTCSSAARPAVRASSS